MPLQFPINSINSTNHFRTITTTSTTRTSIIQWTPISLLQWMTHGPTRTLSTIKTWPVNSKAISSKTRQPTIALHQLDNSINIDPTSIISSIAIEIIIKIFTIIIAITTSINSLRIRATDRSIRVVEVHLQDQLRHELIKKMEKSIKINLLILKKLLILSIFYWLLFFFFFFLETLRDHLQ